jgi:hypothetical protein
LSIAKPKKAAAVRNVVYVYGVARVQPSGESAPLQLEGIIPEASVERLVHGDLVAFVSMVPTSQFGADELHAALADAEWLRGRVLAHERTVEQLCSSRGVVPFRFCTVYRGAAEVSDVLARHRVDLERALDRVRGASEWGVKLYYDPDALRRQVEAASKAIRDLRGTLASAAPGAQFFLRKKFDRALDAEMSSSIATCVERSRQRLDGAAREAVEVEIQPPGAHGKPAVMAMNAAYLVDEAAFGGFKRTLAELGAEFAACGFGYELTGPWPAYHFVSFGQGRDDDAAESGQ